jgi:hypothetical protein
MLFLQIKLSTDLNPSIIFTLWHDEQWIEIFYTVSIILHATFEQFISYDHKLIDWRIPHRQYHQFLLSKNLQLIESHMIRSKKALTRKFGL